MLRTMGKELPILKILWRLLMPNTGVTELKHLSSIFFLRLVLTKRIFFKAWQPNILL